MPQKPRRSESPDSRQLRREIRSLRERSEEIKTHIDELDRRREQLEEATQRSSSQRRKR